MTTNISITDETRVAVTEYLRKQQERHQNRIEQRQTRQRERRMNYNIGEAVIIIERKNDIVKLGRYIESLKKISENLGQRVTPGRLSMYIRSKDNANIDVAVKHIDEAIKALHLIK